MKNTKVNVFIESGIEIISRLTDFNGDLQAWKNAVYDLFRANMTWDFAYRIMVKEGRNGVYVDILIKPEFEKNVKTFMEDSGFGTLRDSKEQIGIIGCEELDLDYVEVE